MRQSIPLIIQSEEAMNVQVPVPSGAWPIEAEQYHQFISDLCENIPEEWDDDVAAEAIILNYVHHLESLVPQEGLALTKLILPAGVKRARGEDRWPPPDTLTLSGGALLKHRGEWVPVGITTGKVYRGPHDLTVIVSLDPRGEPWGTLLHMSMSVARGYPDWNLIYAVTRAVFGDDVDAMMPIPREEAFIHHAVKGQRHVFHVTEMPQAWPSENE